MAIKTSRFAAVDNTPKSRDLIRCLCSFSGDLPACSLSVSAVGGRAEALTTWFPTRRYWGASGCWWIWSWAIFQCSECHVLSPWTPRWKWATTTWVDKPWVAHGGGALIQRYRVILRGGRGVVSCFWGMDPWAEFIWEQKYPRFWGLGLLCHTSFVRFW